MKKFLIFISVLFVFMSPYKVYAANDYEKEINDITEKYGVEYDSIENITFENVINNLTEKVKEKIHTPLKLFIEVASIIAICGILKTINTENKLNIIDTVSVLVIFLALLSPIKDILSHIGENIYAIREFMTAFIPVFAGVTMASGKFVTAAIYNGFFFTSLIFVSNFCIKVILPSINVFFALIVSNALSPFIRLKSLSDFYLKSVKWMMRISVSVICFILTIQTAVSQGKDTLAVKTGKLFAGSVIPIIGSTLQDAVGSVFASMEVIKGFAGAAGLLVVISIFLPGLITLAVYWVYVNGLYILSDMFDINGISQCIKGFISVIELLISIIFLFMIMLIFAITVMISFTNGV